MKLHPVTIMVGLIAFGYFFGIWGMVLATPIIALLKILGNYFINKYNSLTDLLEESEKLSMDEIAYFLGSPSLIRKFIIRSLQCNNFDFEAEAEKIIVDFKDAEKSYPRHFKNFDKAAIEVLEVLRKKFK